MRDAWARRYLFGVGLDLLYKIIDSISVVRQELSLGVLVSA